MSNVAVIAEFHPYHNGHHYLFEEAMSLSHADHAVSLMSGNFLQRGSIALWDKYTRAEMAGAGGFDLWFELPLCVCDRKRQRFCGWCCRNLK